MRKNVPEERHRNAGVRSGIPARGWYYVVAGATSMWLLFMVASLFRRAFPFVFAPLFILAILGIIFGSSYVIRPLLTREGQHRHRRLS